MSFSDQSGLPDVLTAEPVPTPGPRRRRQAVLAAVIGLGAVLALVAGLLLIPRFLAPVAQGVAQGVAAPQIVAAEGTPAGSASDPAPLDTPVLLRAGGEDVYRISLGTPLLNASAEVMAAAAALAASAEENGDTDFIAENIGDLTPPAGMAWASIPLTVTFVGTGLGTPARDLSLRYVDAEGNYGEGADHVSLAPEPALAAFADLASGKTVTGNIAVLVPLENPEAGSLQLSVAGVAADGGSGAEDENAFRFALRG